MGSVLVKGGTVVTMDHARRELDADLLVEDGRIAAIGRDLGAADETVDAEGCLVLPGFIQTHVHLCQSVFRGFADDMDVVDWLRLRIWPLEQAHDYQTAHAAARLGIAEMVRGGTTCALTMETVHHTEAVLDAIVETGFRAFSGKAMMDRREPGTEMTGETTEAALSSAQELAASYDGRANGRLRYAYCPRGSRNCTDELWQEVVAISRRSGAIIHTHAAENEAQTVRLAREGLSDIAYLHSVGAAGPSSVLAHCIWVSPAEVDILTDTSTKVTHCPSCNLKLASGLAQVSRFQARGVNVSLGADGAACNNNLDVFREMRLAALIHKPLAGPKALPAAKVLEMATLGGARALGVDDELGSLEPGKRADVVVVRRDGLHVQPTVGADIASEIVYAHSSADVDTVLIDGEVVLAGGCFTVLDEGEVIAKANESARLLLDRVAHRPDPAAA